MRCILLASLLMILTHTTSLTEEITTGNLLPNGTGSASNLQSVDTTIPNVQSSCSSFTSVNTTCTNSNWNYQEVEVGSTSSGTGTLNYTGTLVDVTTGSETTTQTMLDNGITLDSTTVVQNCEWSGSSHQCGQAQSGRDTFKTTVKILDANGEVLSQVDQIRNTDSGYYSNANKYTDQVIYNGTGSNQFDWTWTGIDGDSTPVNLGGPNLLGAKLTMTYDNIVIENEIIEEINNIFEELQEEIFEEFTFEYIEEIFEEFTLIAPPMEEEFEEITFQPMITIIEEVPMKEEIVEEIIMEEEMIIEEEIKEPSSFFSLIPPPQEEEIYEETEEIIASFLPMVPKEEETFTEEKELVEEEPIMEEEVIEEESTHMASAPKEEEIIEEEAEIVEEEEVTEEKSNRLVEETNEEKEKEEIKEEKSSSETSKKSTVSNKKLTEQKKVQQKEAIKTNLVKIMDKIDKDIKDISKNLQIKNIIKLDAMASDQASLAIYENVEFYKPENIYLNQLNIFDSRQLYPDTSLTSYIKEDPVFIKEQQLKNLDNIKQQLLYELEILKNG